ncbi:MAG: phosphodiester glycosidase family protein, partial [Bacilli bacterium]
MKKIKLFTTLMCFLFIVVAGFSVFVNVSAVTISGIGTVKQSYTRNILDNVTYTYVQSDNDGSPEKNYVLEYDPAVAGVDALAVYGTDQFGADTITENIALAESQGYTVIAGINASPFDTSNGTTVGVMIQNGKLISAPNGLFGYDSFAINDDGSMFISQSNLDMSYSVNDSSYTINYFNKQKKSAENNVYLLDSDWYSDTRSNVDSCEVVLDITNGQAAIGGVLEAKVSTINESTQKTAIGENQLVLIGSDLAALGNLKVGDELSFSFDDNDTANDWSKVAQSTCGFYQVLEDGNVINSSNTDVHPRTLVGYKADGTIVFYVVDGRQPGVSMGLTTRDAALYMKSLGCTNVINLDGGGSSNMTVRLPGSDNLTTVNVPSDGEERHDADGILLVLKDDYDTSIGDETLLHAYPNNAILLKNTVLDISVLATDERYNTKDVPAYTMEVIGSCGSITADNKFKARNGDGSGQVKISNG